VANAGTLRRVLSGLATDNAQGEQYLTDALAPLVDGGAPVAAVRAADPDDVLGCNDRRELAARRRTLNDRVLDDLMRAGVTVVDPATTWVDVTATVAPTRCSSRACSCAGTTSVAPGPSSGPTPPSSTPPSRRAPPWCARTSWAPSSARAPRSARSPTCAPGTRLAAGAKVGAFVETKNADVGEGSKVPHLSYVGDATIGRGANIGAATVFVNYDGVAKHHTTSATRSASGRTRCSWRRSPWATARTPPPGR
jgi:bifunctional UDP-N-acetylglucosamine pyrophosphorylase/glucosamine-1-phosphate N-acetyltransferase